MVHLYPLCPHTYTHTYLFSLLLELPADQIFRDRNKVRQFRCICSVLGKSTFLPAKEGLQAGPRNPRPIRLIWWISQDSLCEASRNSPSNIFGEVVWACPAGVGPGIAFGMLCSPSCVVKALGRGVGPVPTQFYSTSILFPLLSHSRSTAASMLMYIGK